MYIPTTALLSLILTSSLVSAHAPVPNPPHRRHLVRLPKNPNVGKAAIPAPVILQRAGAAISNETLQSISADEAFSSAHPSTAQSSATVTSSVASQTSSTDDSSVAQSSAATTSAASTAPASSAAPSTTVESVTSSDPAPSTVAPVSTIAQTSADTAPSTLSQVSQVTSTVAKTDKVSVVTATKTASTSSTASAASSNSKSEKSSGLSKTALIAIIVVASVVGLAAIGWTIFRKWKLRPSNRFDERMKPIDFSPHNDGMAPAYFEKSLHRTASNQEADLQRKQLVAELDETNPNHVPGIPEHDFTAGTNQAGYGAYNADQYHADPFAHAQAYEYDQYDPNYYHEQHGQEHAYPPAPNQEYNAHDYGHQHHGSQEYPTQDPEEGYANLQRGNSNGSNHGPQSQHQVYPSEFPMPEAYIGRPTGGADGPYAQAAQYRGY